MKKGLLILLMILAVGLASCGSKNSSTSLVTITVGNNQVAFIKSKPATFANKAATFFARHFQGTTAVAAIPSVVSSIRVTVSAADMETISTKESVAGQSSAAITLEVPNGLGRYFLIEGLDSSGAAVTYWGEFIADLTGAELNRVVDMLFIGAAQSYLYVDVTGNDANPGTKTSPFRTITKALSQTTGSVAIFIQAGTYDKNILETFPLTLKVNTALVCLGGNFTTVIDGTGSGATTISGAAGAVVNGCRINGEAVTTVITDNASAMTVISSYVFGNLVSPGSAPSVCIALAGSSRVAKSTITGCSFNNGGVGISISGGSPIIELNTITDNLGTGISIAVGAAAPSPLITGNTIKSNSTGISVGGGTPSIHGNSLFCNTSSDLFTSVSGTLDLTNNAWDHAPPNTQMATCGPGVDICYSTTVPVFDPFNSAVSGFCLP